MVGAHSQSWTRHPRTWRMALLLVVSLGWIVAPPPTSPEQYCGRRIEFTSWAGITVNCDSGGFAGLALHPAEILRVGNLRQSRPVFTLMGTVVGWPIAQVVDRVRPGIEPRAGYFMGYILLNFLFAATAIELFAWLLGAIGATSAEIWLLSVFLIANDLTKAFMWTAHSQLFGPLGPLVTLALCTWLTMRPRSVPSLALVGLLLSLGILSYGMFFVTVGVLLLADAWDGWKQRRTWTQQAIRAAALAVPALLPVALWPVWVSAQIGSFYSHELVVYRQFVWMADAVHLGADAGLALVVKKATLFAATWTTWELAPITLATAAVLWLAPRSMADDPARTLTRHAWLVLAVSGVFVGLMGFYATRLTYGLVPPMLILVGAALTRFPPERRSALRVVLAVAAAGWWLAHETTPGPYS